MATNKKTEKTEKTKLDATRTARAEPKGMRPDMPGYGLPDGAKGLLPWKWAGRCT